MEIVDNPSDFDGTVTFGSFVLVTVDIASSIRGVTDQIAVQAAEALPRARSLAWIRSYTSELGSPLFIIVFLLVGRGLPAAPHSFAAVPIAPNTSHPETGRAAVEASRPLPWPDCYVYTLRGLEAPISRLHQTSDPGVFLDDDKRTPLILAWHEDMQATAGERLAAAIAGGYAVPTGNKIRDHGSYGSVVEDGDSESGSETSSRDLSYDECSGHDPASRRASRCSASSDRAGSAPAPAAVHLDAVEIDPEFEDKRIVLHVEVSNILDPSADFGTVDEFLSVIDQLSEIEADRAERAVTVHLSRAAAPKTTAWLQGISDAGALDDATPGDATHLATSQEGPPAPRAELDSAARVVDAAGPPYRLQHRDGASKRDSSGPPTDAHSSLPTLPRPIEPQLVLAVSAPDSAPRRSSCPEPSRNREGGESLPSDRTPTEPGKTDAERAPEPWTLRILLSVVISRLRNLIARCRAFF